MEEISNSPKKILLTSKAFRSLPLIASHVAKKIRIGSTSATVLSNLPTARSMPIIYNMHIRKESVSLLILNECILFLIRNNIEVNPKNMYFGENGIELILGTPGTYNKSNMQ